MRAVIAMMKHETNTFSPLPTPLASFGRGHDGGPLAGDEGIAQVAGTNNAMAAFLDLARERGWQIDVPLVAAAVPSGTVGRDAFEAMCAPIVAAVVRDCDVVLLDLHGAMVVDGFDDPEGELLRRIRAAAPAVPVAVTFDFHGNFSPVTFANADVITGYRTYPHVDMYEAGARAGRTLVAQLESRCRPRVVWRRVPMLTHMNRQTPSRPPMQPIMERAIAAEANGEVLNASVFGGFPLADIPWVGLSIVLVADEALLARAEALADELAGKAWSTRRDFVFESEPPGASIARAAAIREGPVILADHGDNAGAGGVTDDMSVLAAALDAQLDGIIAGPFVDPGAVAELIAAGVGRRIALDVGGKTDMPAVNLRGTPLRLEGIVRCITDGCYTVTGPMMTGSKLSLGRTAVLDTGRACVVVSERPQEPFDVGVFTHCGLDPAHAHYVLIKSRQHFRAGFEPIAKTIILVAGPGVCTSEYARLPFARVPRPLFPLDPDATYGPEVTT